MMNKIILFITTIFFLGCDSVPTEEMIYAEYTRLAEKYNAQVRIGHISIIKVNERSLSVLAAREEERLTKLENLLKKRIENGVVIDSLMRATLKLTEEQCSDYRYNSDSHFECLHNLHRDSLDYVKSFYELERLKVRSKDNQEQLKIIDDINAGWGAGKDAYVIVHTIELLFKDQFLTDTLLFYSFENNSYTYLDRNPFINEAIKPK